MALKVKYTKKDLNLENAYLKLREVCIQDSGVVILKSSIYKSKENRDKNINEIDLPISNIYLTKEEAKQFIDLVFGKAYKFLKDKIESEKDDKNNKILKFKHLKILEDN